MKAYTNKPQRVDPARCLLSELTYGKKAAKKAARQQAKRMIDDEQV